eukprot:scaffold62411_cov59-Phaeocystis_antarctica.AAC.2
MSKAAAVACAQSFESTDQRSLASRYRCAASAKCPEALSVLPRLKYATGWSGSSAMASRNALPALRKSC